MKSEKVKQEERQEFEQYRIAAVQGDAYAQYNLGFMYDTGKASGKTKFRQ